jgi:hypothetical protein
MKLLVISGRKGSGKDTLATYLINNGWKSMAYADTLKEALIVLFDWDKSIFEHSTKELIDNEWGTSPREMCQLLGTEFLRERCSFLNTTIYHPISNEPFQATFHIKRIHQKILKLLENDPNTNIVITDGRFPDEIEYAKWMGGIVIKIERPTLIVNQYSNHASEHNIDKLAYDHLIINDGTKEDMWDKIKKILFKISI